MTHTTNKILALASAAAAVLFATGCHSDKSDAADTSWQDPFFPPTTSTPATKTMYQRQFAIAAVQDGMLFPVHFDGDELNGLGQAKVDLMMQGRSATTPLQVYLNQPANDATNNARVASLTRAFKAAGLTDEDFKVAVGPNPNTLMPAEAGIRALSAAEGASVEESDGGSVSTGTPTANPAAH